MSSILEVRNLHLLISQKQMIETVLNISKLDIQAGQIHGLVGESGAGKSMLAKAVLGILPPSTITQSGNIRFGETDLLGIDSKERSQFASRHIAMIPQDPMTSMNPLRKIGRQICDVLQLHTGLSRKERIDRALQLLHDVQIREPFRVMQQYPFEVSGGMRQRVLIAIAFSCGPELIIADEPTTALDVTVQRQILQLIKRLQLEFNTALLFITHDLGVVAKICDVVSVIQDGEIVESQPVEELFQDPQHPYTQSLLETTSQYYSLEHQLLTQSESQVVEKMSIQQSES